MAVYFPPMFAVSPLDFLGFELPPEYLELGFCAQMWDEYQTKINGCHERPYLRTLTPGWVNNTIGPYTVTAELNLIWPSNDIHLFYRLNGGGWYEEQMQPYGMLVGARIDGQPNGTVIEYYFLDNLNNITEPYEVKWGSGDYLTFTVNATCDIAITDLELVTEGEIWAGNVTTFRVNCTNLGPEPAEARIAWTIISLELNAIVLVEHSNATVGPGENVSLLFNWTAQPGNWTVIAAADRGEVTDTNESNQAGTVSFPVSGTDPDIAGSTFFEDYWALLLGLALIWAVSMLAIIYILGKGRRRRREGVARSIKSAREFIATTEQFGADTFEAKVMLAKADAALAGKRFNEAEFLVSEARESAMRKVGNSPGPGEGTRAPERGEK
jgi:hypothetical protein